jgi:anti-sigma factor RsiW
MTTCKDSIELLQAYLDGELPAEEQLRLESHLGDCTPCEEFLATYRETPKLCREALQQRMPKEIASRLTAFLRGAIGGDGCGCACDSKKPKDE